MYISLSLEVNRSTGTRLMNIFSLIIIFFKLRVFPIYCKKKMAVVHNNEYRDFI